MSNPMDSTRDIYEWPYGWSRQVAWQVTEFFMALDVLFDNLDPWTYHNHVAFTDDPADPRWPWLLDLFAVTGSYERSQMPLPLGDEICSEIVDRWPSLVRQINWNFRYWQPGHGWRSWTGPQGDFVTHVHIEFDSEALAEWAS